VSARLSAPGYGAADNVDYLTARDDRAHAHALARPKGQNGATTTLASCSTNGGGAARDSPRSHESAASRRRGCTGGRRSSTRRHPRLGRRWCQRRSSPRAGRG
jgi:hypothetical protein